MKSTLRRVFVMAGLFALFASTMGAVASSTAAGASQSNSSLLGPTKKATGQPLKIGFIYSGQSQAADFRGELAIGQATVKYVNQHLGGVGGRPIQLVACADNQSPATAADCANQMVATQVPVVLQPLPTQPAAVINVLAPAKIPYFVGSASDQTTLLSPYGNVLDNGLGVFAAGIRTAVASKSKKLGVLVLDVPAAAQTGTLVSLLAKADGIQGTTTLVPLGTPDLSPQIEADVSQGVGTFLLLLNPQVCLAAMKAIKSLAPNSNVVLISQCFDPGFAKQAGGLNGVKLATSEVLDPSAPQVKLYHAVAATYAPGTPPDSASNPDAYEIVLGFVRAMKTLNPSAVTPATVQQAFASMAPSPLPLLPGQTFQCNRRQVTIAPAICATGTAIVTLNAAGNGTNTVVFNSAPYIKLS